MILGISKDFIKFFLLYACTLIAFGFGFHVLCSRKEPFSDPMESVLFTLAMMVGEFNYIDLFTREHVEYNWTTQILFTAFLLMVSIIIMNLLVGLAISNITGQLQSAGVYRLKVPPPHNNFFLPSSLIHPTLYRSELLPSTD